RPPHGSGGIERLGDANKASTCPVEYIDDPGKIGETAGEPVDLVEQNNIDPVCRYIGEQALQARALHIAAREPAIIVTLFHQHPAFVTLAQSIGRTSLILRIKAIELLLEPILGRFARIDSAAKKF